MKSRYFSIRVFIMVTMYLLCACQMRHFASGASSRNTESPSRSLDRGPSRRCPPKGIPYWRMKPDVFKNDFVGNDDDDLFDLTKRQQQPNSDDYGHMRFGKRDEQFDDYGHMRFGRNGGD